MNTEQKFYVYEHIRPDTGAVFYVGKGCRNRATTSSRRSQHWQNVVAKVGGREVRYIVKNVDEELAYFCEEEALDKYKRLGVRLTNKTDGGGGTNGYRFTMSNEHKQKISQAKIGVSRPKEMVERMKATKKGKLTGKDNPFFGKHHTEETKELLRIKAGQRNHSEEAKIKISQALLKTYATHKKCKPVYCITNGVTYWSISEAARQLNLQIACISLVCNKKMHHSGNYKFEWSKK